MNHLLQNATPPYGDVEFVDPAIMEVGKGVLQARLNNPGCNVRPASSLQLSPFDHNTELQMLMRQSISAQQNLRFPDHFTNRFSPPTPSDAYSTLPMLLGQSPPNKPPAFAQMTAQQLRNLHMSNDRWADWNEVNGVSDLGMSELLKNQGLGFNNFIPSYEDLKCQMSSSSNLYNRGFAM